MAIRRVEAFLFPLLLLLLSSSCLLASSSKSDPEKKRCVMECRGIPEQQQRKLCVHRCLDHSGEQESGREHNPYYFGRRSYQQWSRTEHGRLEVLERFARRSDHLLGVDNYRLAVLEAEPQTFIMPCHWDAEQVVYVMQGRGTITLLHEERRESHDIKRGDIMRVPAGVIVYAINKASNERLRVAMLLHPVSTPGQIEEYHGAAGRNPQTFYTSFSNEVLEAAFNTPWDKLERMFRSQRKGEIIKITEDQIRALNESKTESWPFGLSNEPYNLLENSPSHSNEHGQLHEATGNECEMLQDLNVDVSITNISERSMMAPNYDTRSTKLAMVVEGRGYIEMACPHRSAERRRTQEESGSQGEQRVRYRTVRSRVSRGSVFVIPAGHPAAVVAAANENLQVLCFGIRSENNRRYYLAGRNNVLHRLDRAAKAMAFGVPAEEVEEVLNAQPESVFMPGPERRREEEEKRRQLVFKYAGF
ncbi:vicilin Cor a 11.0101-like [Musa acuminata AAA Group]|uniref:vicilin Cor a 11.0101-like n=1 Tax=Musa acuminata AAA Group TaxID=214697 RepID=UPI0031DC9E93